MASTRTRLTTAAIVAVTAASLASARLAGQDALAHAKDLYASAEYSEALAVLNRPDVVSENVEIDQYRALCLLALGRGEEATQVIERIVQKNPTFEPSATQVSPRVQTTFRDVRKRLLPSIVRQTYADAKSAFDAGDTDRAKVRFQNVVAQLDALTTMGSTELGDLRVLSTGFLDLIIKTSKPAAAPAPVPALPPAAAAILGGASPPAPASSPKTAAAPAPPAIHIAGEPGITAPVAISQTMPPWEPSRADTRTYVAVLSFVIDEKGTVTDISINGDLRPAYEASLRRATGSWRFQPATKDGVPVKYRKTIAIRLTAGPDGK
jgi:TonB-like protein